jgi:uncharacterized protein (TIGR00730 family)
MQTRVLLFLRGLLGMSKVFAQLLYGIWHVSRATTPMVTIFGTSRAIKGQVYFQQAHNLGLMLVQDDISVLTGGGGGIMEAASCGALLKKNRKAKIIGIGVKNLDQEKNQCVDDYLSLDYFFARKWLLTHYSSGFVVFPGGFGTLDELFEILTLLQTKQIESVPIILIGIEYWEPFVNWIKTEAIKHQFIGQRELNLFAVTDRIEDAFQLLKKNIKTNPTNNAK